MHLLNKDAAHEIESIIQKQIDVLGEMFHALQCDRTIHEQDFSKLAELEKNLIKRKRLVLGWIPFYPDIVHNS